MAHIIGSLVVHDINNFKNFMCICMYIAFDPLNSYDKLIYNFLLLFFPLLMCVSIVSTRCSIKFLSWQSLDNLQAQNFQCLCTRPSTMKGNISSNLELLNFHHPLVWQDLICLFFSWLQERSSNSNIDRVMLYRQQGLNLNSINQTWNCIGA